MGLEEQYPEMIGSAIAYHDLHPEDPTYPEFILGLIICNEIMKLSGDPSED